MPVMNGLNAAEILLPILPDLRLVLFTAHDGPEVMRLAQGVGIPVAKIRATATLVAEGQFLMCQTAATSWLIVAVCRWLENAITLKTLVKRV